MAKRTTVTFGLASGLRVSKASSVTGSGGRGREMRSCRHFRIWSRTAEERSEEGRGEKREKRKERGEGRERRREEEEEEERKGEERG